MGLIGYVYRNADDAYDCTKNGWSSHFTRVCIVNAEGPFSPDERHIGVKVVRHRTMKSLHVISLEDEASGKWTMFGGNYMACSDSRFSALCQQLLGESSRLGVGAISIHDRIED